MKKFKFFSRFKSRVQHFKINFQEKLKEAREKPRSKRKSFGIGFTTSLAIFGVTLFGPALVAFAKDIPKVNPKPTDIAPAPSVTPSKAIINTGLSGMGASICGLAVTSGSFLVGGLCGIVVVIGILHLQGK
jgi:hypothetical protein